MKAQELRLGNYLQGKTVVQVSAIHKDKSVSVIGNSSRFYVHGEYPCLKPIPLTEEWLLKFGFEEDGEQFNLRGLSIEDIHNGEKWCVYMFDEYHAVECSLALIQHVHQLQNLYFALTGEELTLQENGNQSN